MKAHYHPVSLSVIRGALVFNGFSIERIRRMDVDLPEGQAIYHVYIFNLDGRSPLGLTPRTVLSAANGAFSTDVECVSVTYSRNQWCLVLHANVEKENEPDSETEVDRGLPESTLHGLKESDRLAWLDRRGEEPAGYDTPVFDDETGPNAG